MKTTKPTPSNLSLVQIMQYFNTDEKAREYLENVRWPNGTVCPRCGCTDKVWPIAENIKQKIRPGLYECGECKRQFTVTVGTIFEDTHVPLRKWLIAWYLLCSSKKGFSALQLQRTLELGSYRTAWFMAHRIRYALKDPAFSGKLGGNGETVEADETFIGGVKHGKGRAYKGNKIAVMSFMERGGRVRSMILQKVTGRNLTKALELHVDGDSTLMTDDYRGYNKPGRKFKAHFTVTHSKKEYVRGEVHTNTVEGYFANLKRGIDRIYHHVGRHLLSQYLGEFDFRYNTRHMTDGERTKLGLARVSGKRLMLRKPIQGRP